MFWTVVDFIQNDENHLSISFALISLTDQKALGGKITGPNFMKNKFIVFCMKFPIS